MVNHRLKLGIASTLIISGGLPLAASMLIHVYLPGWHRINVPLHSSIEAVGAFIALIVAALLMLRTKTEADVAHFPWMAAAFISMGLMDALYAGLHVGFAFIWIRGLATLSGGILVSLVWLSDRLAKARLTRPVLMVVLVIMGGLLVVVFSFAEPATYDGQFTSWIKTINFIGGAFFLAASVFFLIRYLTLASMDDLLFANQTLLFGEAGILFHDSTLWDASWWSWHFVRLFAYLLVLGQCLSVYYRMRESARQSREELQRVMSSISDFLWSGDVDREGKWSYHYFSSVCEKITGRPADYYMQGLERWLSTVHPEDRPRLVKAFERVRTEQSSHEEEEYRIVLPDGAVRWVRDSVRARLEKGSIRIDGVVSDVTDRKRAEEKNLQLASIVECSDDAIGSSTLDGIITNWNRGAEDIFGYSAEEIIGRPVSVLFPGDRADERTEILKRIQRGEKIEHFETERLNKKGQRIALSLTYSPVRNSNDELTGCSIIARDVTKQRQAELNYAAIFNAANDAIMVHDIQTGAILDVNRRMTEMYGYTTEEARCLDVEALSAGTPPYTQQDALHWLKKALDGEPQLLEWLAKDKAGRLFWVEVNIKRSIIGDTERLLAIVRDISERKKVEDELRRSRGELRALAAQLILAREEESKRLARDLHDAFGQKLAVLNLQVSELESQLSAKSDATVKQLRPLREGIGSLAQDIHQLSRQLHPAVLRELGLEIAVESECAMHSRQEGIPVRFSSESVPEQIPGDIPLCLYRVLQESLQNIRKHALAKNVEVKLVGAENEILLVVEDSGVGFDPTEVRRKGGLGLVSMEERIRLVGGNLSISSKPGQGTRIEVRCPLERN